jgi:hypothetical protein
VTSTAAVVAHGDALRWRPREATSVTVSLRLLDEGAWVSVNDSRVVGNSDVWRLADHAVCDCETAFFVVEVFTDVAVDDRSVDARAGGRCIGCGESATTDWLTVGRVDDGEFRRVAVDGVHVPG